MGGPKDTGTVAVMMMRTRRLEQIGADILEYMRADISEHTHGSTHMRADICEHTYESTHMKAHIEEHTHMKAHI